jgi:spore coat polysaccharide biosynthesis protein SpsF
MCWIVTTNPPKKNKAAIIVRITADCPVIDPALIDNVVRILIEGEYDFACNRLPPPWGRTYPIGLDTEVCTFAALERAWKDAKEPQHREHVMPYFYEGVELITENRSLQTGTSPRGFNVALLHHTTDFGNYRWTVDTPEDLEFMQEVYRRFDKRDDFTWKEVLDLVHNEPRLMGINAGVQHKTLKDIDKRALKR